MSLRTLGGLSWNDAWDLTGELMRDPTSHTAAAVSGWAYVPPPESVAAYWLLEGWINAQRKPNSIPTTIARPWIAAGAAAAQPEYPNDPPKPVDAEALERRRKLARRYGLPEPD